LTNYALRSSRALVQGAWLVNAYSSKFMHKTKVVGPQSIKGVDYGTKRVDFQHKGGWYLR
jgi:hypothetical protein